MDEKITQLAKLIKIRREQHELPYVLLLGAATDVGDPMQYEGLSADERYNLLCALSCDEALYAGYQALAALVQAGYFDVILTTEVSTALEDCLMDVGMRRKDFATFAVGYDRDERLDDVLRPKRPRVKLVKLNGDLQKRECTLTDVETFEFKEPVAAATERILQRDLLIVNFQYQRNVNHCLGREGGALWYVNPDPPTGELGTLMRIRKGNFLAGDLPSLCRALYRELEGQEFDVAGLSLPEGPVLHNLPPRRFFVERDSYSDQIMEQLSATQETVWITGICGLTGVGKTMLALEVAHRCLTQRLFEAIVWMTAEQEILTTRGTVKRESVLTSFEDLYDAIAETLGYDDILKMESIAEKHDAIRKILKEKRCLLLVDSLASLGGEGIVRKLRDFVQPTKIIVTSRPRIEPLDRVCFLKGMEQEPALELMREECENKSVKASDEELITLYEHTGGIPLAVVWCVGLMSELPVRRVLDKMHEVKGDLLQYCFANSLDELSPEAKRLLYIASLFVTSASYDALYAISGMGDEDAFDDEIRKLIRLSLIYREEDYRYSLLPLTREFVLSEMEQLGLDEAIRLRYAYADYFLHYAEEYSSRSEEDLDALAIEHSNIKEAVTWCKYQEAEHIKRLLPGFATALHEFQWLNGYWNELAEYNELAFQVSESLQDWGQAGHHAYAIGFTRFQQGDYDEADRWGTEAVSAMAQAADEYHLARVKRLPAMVARMRGDYQTSKHWLDEMLGSGNELLETAKTDEEIRTIKDNILADALTTLANLERDLGKNYSEARHLYEEALAINRELGNTEKIGLNLNHLGRVDLAEYEQAKSSGQHDEATRYLALAEEHFTEGRQASEAAPRTDQILIGMWGQGRVAEERGEYAQALKLAQEALERCGHCGAAEIAEAQELLSRVERLMPSNARQTW
ncbi:MAG: NB-ARC domain-containing protein [Anaerolineae bacterium]